MFKKNKQVWVQNVLIGFIEIRIDEYLIYHD